MNKRLVCILLLLTLLAAVTAGCAGTPTAPTPGAPGTAAPVSAAPAAGQPPAVIPNPDYVSETPLKLSLWVGIGGKGFEGMTSYNDIWAFRKWQEMTNVEIEWLHPPVGQETDQMNLIFASRDFPDIAYYGWMSSYPGGPEKAILDGVILKLNDYFTPESSPNIMKLYDEHELFKKNSTTDQGSFYMYPFVRGYCLYEYSKWSTMFNGPQYRADWLEALGIATPDTIDEWHKALVAIRDNDCNGNGDAKDEIPLVSPAKDLNAWVAPFGTLAGWRLKDDKVVYGYLDPEFKEYLTTMSTWFKEGLIDKDYLVTDGNMFKTKVVSNVGGVYIGGIGGNFGGNTQAMQAEHGDKDVIMAAKWPINAEGKRYTSENTRKTLGMGGGCAIFTTNKHIKESAKLLDLAYRWDMIDIMNFGEPGVTFVRTGDHVDLVPKFKEEMLAAKDQNTVINKYATAGINGWATFMHPDYDKLQYNIRNQVLAIQTWNQWDAGLTDELVLPPITQTSEESSEFANIMTQVDTYVAENRNKVIMGELPVSHWDTVVAELKNMKIDRAVELRNNALTRYNAR